MPSSDVISDTQAAQGSNRGPTGGMRKNVDGFMKPVYRIFDGLAKHSRGLGAFVAVVLLLMLASALVMGRREQGAAEARSGLFLAQKKYDAELKAVLPAPKPAAEPTQAKDAAKKTAAPTVEEIEFSALDVDAKFPDTVKAYKEVIQKHGGTRSAFDARLALGHLYLQHGRAAQAEEWMSQAAAAAPRGLERALAYSSLGYAREASGKHKEAIDSYNQALATGEDSIKGDSLMAVARCYEELRDTANARATYEKVTSQLPNTEYAKNAELYKNQL